MPRPKVKGKVCQLPENVIFGPFNHTDEQTTILYLSIEEYESIRIIDLLGESQEKCAQAMNLSRTTLQRIYYSAKQKIADAIINGKILKIEGGNYQLCRKSFECYKLLHCSRLFTD